MNQSTRRNWRLGGQTGGRIMLNLDAFKPNWRCAADAFGALAIGTISFSGSAAATPLQLFPFIMAPPAQCAPPPVQSAPSEDEGPISEMQARFKRQIDSYATSDSPCTR